MKYQPVINTLTTRQSCKIVNIKNPIEDEFAEFGELRKKNRSPFVDVPIRLRSSQTRVPAALDMNLNVHTTSQRTRIMRR
jgi:hypothetical protein